MYISCISSEIVRPFNIKDGPDFGPDSSHGPTDLSLHKCDNEIDSQGNGEMSELSIVIETAHA